MDLNFEQLQKVFSCRSSQLFSKIEIVDKNGNIVDEITSIILSGNYNATNDSLVRRTINCEMQYNDKYKIEQKKDSPLWMNKRIKVWLGIQNTFTDLYNNGEILWFNYGYYKNNDASTNENLNSHTISITASDRMKDYEYQVGNKIVLETGTPITQVMRLLPAIYGNSDYKYIDDLSESYSIPYKKEWDDSVNAIDIMRECLELYMYHEYFVDMDDVFHYQVMKNRIYDSPVWIFGKDNEYEVSKSTSMPLSSIINHVIVEGYLDDDTGIQPRYEIEIEDVNNACHKNQIGDRRKYLSMDKYTTTEQCKLMAEYTLEQNQNLVNTFTIQTVPILSINEVNKVIWVWYNNENIVCQIDNISFDFKDGTQNITCHQIFE